MLPRPCLYLILHTRYSLDLVPSNPANQPTDQPINSATLPVWAFVVLPATWFLNLRLFLTHDPLAKAIQLGDSTGELKKLS